MMYQGGKTRLAKQIASHLLDASSGSTTYLEPFVGSAAVLSRVAPFFAQIVAADAMPDLIMMWQAARDGWKPPESLSLEEYRSLRDADPSALRAFAGFPCSFAGKWFGGYASDPKSDRNYARAASRSIVRRCASMQHVRFVHADYRELGHLVGPGVLVYADPPYANTTSYKGTSQFNTTEFWSHMDQWAASGARVFVSEYDAPAGWAEVWRVKRHVPTALNNSNACAVDRLFTR